jgi:hypothetical protein
VILDWFVHCFFDERLECMIWVSKACNVQIVDPSLQKEFFLCGPLPFFIKDQDVALCFRMLIQLIQITFGISQE